MSRNEIAAIGTAAALTLGAEFALYHYAEKRPLLIIERTHATTEGRLNLREDLNYHLEVWQKKQERTHIKQFEKDLKNYSDAKLSEKIEMLSIEKKFVEALIKHNTQISGAEEPVKAMKDVKKMLDFMEKKAKEEQQKRKQIPIRNQYGDVLAKKRSVENRNGGKPGMNTKQQQGNIRRTQNRGSR